MTDTVIKAKKLLKENNQEDIIKILDKIDTEKQEKLAREILKLNFKQLHDLYKETKERPEILEKKIEHIKYSNKYKLSEEELEKIPNEDMIETILEFNSCRNSLT